MTVHPVRVRACARCGRDHERIEFKAFKHAPIEASHWATCPRTGEPLLMQFEREPAP